MDEPGDRQRRLSVELVRAGDRGRAGGEDAAGGFGFCQRQLADEILEEHALEVVVADPQVFARGMDRPPRVEVGGEDAEIDVGEDRAEEDAAVARLDELRHLAAPHPPFIEADVERMDLADDTFSEERRGDGDPCGFGQRDRIGLEPVALQLDARDDHRGLGLLDPLDRLADRLGQCRWIADARRGGVGADRIGDDVDHVARQLDVDRALLPEADVEDPVDLAEGGVGIGDLGARRRHLLEDFELRRPLTDAVMEKWPFAPFAQARSPGDHHHRALLRPGPGGRVDDREPPHAVGDAQGADAVDPGIGVGGVAGAVLARAIDQLERALLEHRVEPEHIVARHAEDMAERIVTEAADQVFPDRELRDAPGTVSVALRTLGHDSPLLTTPSCRR